MEEDQHPLYFEANNLTEREMEKISRYFQRKRESGGGECSVIHCVTDHVYKICFQEKEVQERVLQKKFHTISLPSGELTLSVTRTNPLQTPAQSQTQTFTKANTKNLEKIYKLEVYLLYYLRDNLKANKYLQKQLSFIGCTLEIDVDKEEVVVRGDIEKGPGGACGTAEKWEIQVDQVFIGVTDSYLCYHVVDPKQNRMLLQDSSFETDDIKIYREIGYSVVVGEAQGVKDKIADLEKSLPTRKELPLVNKDFILVEEEFSREMTARYLGVKIHRSNNILIMEGSEREVESGATKLNDLMRNVLKKTVKLHPDLLDFIKLSGAVAMYQSRFQHSLRKPVSLEVGSDLVLSSLSSDALDEAEAAVKRDLSVETVKLQGAGAAPADLNRVKDVLVKAKNESNCQEHRVNFTIIPGTSETTETEVRIVGWRENVSELKEALHDYQMNQVRTQEELDLPYPELVDCFDEAMSLIGLKGTDVTMTASHFPYPCVRLSGPLGRVQEVQWNLIEVLSSLTSDILELDGPGARRYFLGEGKVNKDLVESSYQVLIREKQGANSTAVRTTTTDISRASIAGPANAQLNRVNVAEDISNNKPSLKIAAGSLEDELVDVLVVPMLNKQLASTNIGKCLLAKAGIALNTNFNSAAVNCTVSPGDVLQVTVPPSLGCSKLFFIECLPWDGVRGQSEQALGKGLRTCLDLCVQQGLKTIAFPVIGPGVVLGYMLREAVEVLTDSICQFGLSSSAASLSTIHVVIKPGYPDSEKCYHEIYANLSSNMNQGGNVIFRSLTSDLDDITMTVGSGVRLRMVFGDITNETTDAIVNTTDFVNFDNAGVCRDILTVAGAAVLADLKAAQVTRGQVFWTGPGSFPCKAILHVCGFSDAGLIQQLVYAVIQLCESSGYKSVAIPAICAGAGRMDPGVVADAILQGVDSATSSGPLCHLTDIHLVLLKIDVFLEFKKRVTQLFSAAASNLGDGNGCFVSVPQLSHAQPNPPGSATPPDLSILRTSSMHQQSVFLFLGLTEKDVTDAKEKLKALYLAQCSQQTFRTEELEGLSQDDIVGLKLLVERQGLYIQSGQGGLTVSGLKDGVNQVTQMINASLHGTLRRQVRVREEEDLYSRVAWCILGPNGQWERLPKTANHKLEHNNIADGIRDVQNTDWLVNPQKTEVTRRLTGQRSSLKRLENLADFSLPLYWDNMAAGEDMKVVTLTPSSAEYRTVKAAFKQTVNKTVMKIARLQNVHLRRAYEAQKKRITDKNSQGGGAGERLLYHGTTQDNCDSIMKTGFDRRFAGQNATTYGCGTYFAVNAIYSAHPTYSRPTADGSQLMFVARVLTGIYTTGHLGMTVPPPRNNGQPHDRFDSVVDRMNNPQMFVVFHDNQAYPDYLITFK